MSSSSWFGILISYTHFSFIKNGEFPTVNTIVIFKLKPLMCVHSIKKQPKKKKKMEILSNQYGNLFLAGVYRKADNDAVYIQIRRKILKKKKIGLSVSQWARRWETCGAVKKLFKQSYGNSMPISSCEENSWTN